MLKKYHFLIFLLFSFVSTYAQNLLPDAPHIKTVIFNAYGANNYVPIIRLGEKLQLRFDDLNGNETDYYYRIQHCDYNWEPSVISANEYINGYAEDKISNYENSFNTLQNYTHYYETFPNADTKFKISGNYILTVKDEYDAVVFQRKFIIYKPKVNVGVAVYRSRNIASINTQQAIEFSINYENYRINNPKNEIVPVVLQNNNWNTAILGLKPQFYRGTQLLYKYNDETSFWAGNEFLHFETKSIRNTNLYVSNVALLNLYNSYLYGNEPRFNQPYTLFPDINGNFIINAVEGDNANVDADYSWIHFYLNNEKLADKKVYVYGNFNNWQLTNENLMTYNDESGFYEGKLLLKQGFYNYQYVTVNTENTINNYEIDGSFYQTENDYTVLVYYKPFGSRYTKVIGVG
ncbi:MAG TPA: DUF5103 domain-containing protein, partial [Flavobacteriaceae bacterium]|nr:DUF5103 domain-containing protein [Flavobacteriaceae bacterium]